MRLNNLAQIVIPRCLLICFHRPIIHLNVGQIVMKMLLYKDFSLFLDLV